MEQSTKDKQNINDLVAELRKGEQDVLNYLEQPDAHIEGCATLMAQLFSDLQKLQHSMEQLPENKQTNNTSMDKHSTSQKDSDNNME
jgi:hypothetical protein